MSEAPEYYTIEQLAAAAGPEYYTIDGLAAAAGKSKRQVHVHVKKDVGGLSKAKQRVPGLGVRFVASKCWKYISLCNAS